MEWDTLQLRKENEAKRLRIEIKDFENQIEQLQVQLKEKTTAYKELNWHPEFYFYNLNKPAGTELPHK